MQSLVPPGRSWLAIATPAQNTGSRAALAIIVPCQPNHGAYRGSSCAGSRLPKLWQFVHVLAGANALVSVFGSVGVAWAGPEESEASTSEQGKIVQRDISAI